MSTVKLNALLIDDESSSRGSLRQKLLHNCPDVSIAGECENAEEGIRLIGEIGPDLVFLDVEMPRINGFTMLQQLNDRRFEVIFITAYDHYAVRAIKYSALDYLVKPVGVEDLKEAVKKASLKRAESLANLRLESLMQNLKNEKAELQRLALPSVEGLQFVETSDIIYLEADSNYTCFHLLKNSKVTVGKTMKDFEDLLPAGQFIRIHHSYIINKSMVERYIRGEGGQVVMTNGAVLDVARRKKEDFLKAVTNK